MKTVEEKAKAYDEALAKVRMYRDNAKAVEDYAAVARYENVFPELTESEDERIRTALIDFFGEQCDMSDVNGVYAYEVVAWLERQKEQKPIKGGDIITKDTDRYHRVFMVLGTVDERNYNEEYSRYCESLLLGVDGNVYCNNTDLKGFRIANIEERAQFLHDFKCSVSVKQKPAWSEEDERKLNDVICIVGKSGLITPYREHYIRFLKSLCPPFKPTQEQMEAFEESLMSVACTENKIILESFLEQLKKL